MSRRNDSPEGNHSNAGFTRNVKKFNGRSAFVKAGTDMGSPKPTEAVVYSRSETIEATCGVDRDRYALAKLRAAMHGKVEIAAIREDIPRAPIRFPVGSRACK